MYSSTHGGSICLVTNDLDGVVRNSGIGTYFSLMAPLLARHGWRVHVLYLGGVDDPEALAKVPRMFASQGIGFSALKDFEQPGYLRQGQIHAPWFVTVGARARHALEELHRIHHFDLVEFPDWLAFGFSSIQAKRSSRFLENARLCVKLHGTSAWQREGNHRWIERPDELTADYCERYAFEHADVQMSPSRFMLDYVQQAGWTVRDNAIICYVYPEPTLNVPWPVRAPRELVFFGRLEFRKGLNIFIEALRDLDPELAVTFLGRDTALPTGEMATQYIARQMADRQFKILGDYNREQALDYLSSGERLAVIASNSETFGFTVAECAVNGLPFIATDVGGIPEVTDDKLINEQILFKPTVDDLADRIQQYLKSKPDELHALIQRIQKAVDPDVKNASVIAKYNQILEAPGAKVVAMQSAWQHQELAATGTDGPRRARPTRWPSEHYIRIQPDISKSSHVEETGDEDKIVTFPKSDPLVTVAVSYYNLAEFLPETLAGLAKQTWTNLEVLVVDDGSPSAIAIRVFEEQQRRYPQFTFISQANGGPGKARNLALSLARGEFFITVDADNIPRPDMVERFVEGFARHGKCSVLTCYVAAFRGIESLKREEFEFLYIPTGGPHVAACFTNVYGDTNAMFRAADLRAVGGFETDHRTPFEDWETFIKIANAGHSIDVIPEPLFFYRLRGDNRSFTMTKSYTETYPFMRRIVKSLCATPGSTDSELESVWHYVAGIEAQARRRHQLELQVGELRAQLDMLLSVQEQASAQHAIIEELSRHRLRLRYRAADKCVNALRRVPIVHGICRRALPVFWRGWKAIKGKSGD